MANQKILDQKKKVVDEIIDKVKTSASIVLFEYHGLSVNDTIALRKKLKNVDSDYKVYKNTLVKRALNDLKINVDQHLNGPKAIAFGNDAIAPIKILSDFAKTHPSLEMKVGYVDGTIADNKTLNELALIPSREGLLTMLAGSLVGVVKDLSISLNLYTEKLEK